MSAEPEVVSLYNRRQRAALAQRDHITRRSGCSKHRRFSLAGAIGALRVGVEQNRMIEAGSSWTSREEFRG